MRFTRLSPLLPLLPAACATAIRPAAHEQSGAQTVEQRSAALLRQKLQT